MRKDIIIVAPHADDEIIGCFDVLRTGRVSHVLFSTQDACREALKSASHFGFIGEYAATHTPRVFGLHNTYLFPDPYTELHPHHRAWGHKGEELARMGYNVYFYSTNMQAPYIRESMFPALKKESLDILYPEKKELWAYDHKYFLFEGQTKWKMTWRD